MLPVVSQKLAYLYGWPELLEKGQEPDDETILRFTLFIGVMMGAGGANKIMSDLAKKFASQVAKRLPREALTKYGIYNLIKQIGKWIGIQITKNTFSRALAKVIPILGGGINAAVSISILPYRTELYIS